MKKIFALALALAMVMGTMCVPAFAEGTTDRSIVMTPSKDEVRTGEAFTVTVSVDHESEELKFAAWDLTYTEEYFTYVSAELADPYIADESVLVMNRGGNPLTPDVYATTGYSLSGDIMVYTFVAKKTAVTDEPFNFDSNNVRTGNDGWTGEDVTDKTEKTETDVTILEREFTVTQLYDNVAVAGDSVSDIFDNQEHTFAVTAELETDDADKTAPTITYTIDGADLGGTAPTFTAADTYTVTYTIEKEGYTTVNGTVTVEMETAAFENVTIGFTTEGGTEDVTADIEDGAYEFPYDGSAHQLVVNSAETVDGSDVTIKYSLNDGAATTTSPEITAAGQHKITYTIEAPNHTTITKEVVVTITDPVMFVEVLLGEGNDYTSGDKMVLVYTDAENVSFKYDGEQMYDVSGGEYKYGENKEEFEHVFALVVASTGVDSIESYEEYVSVNYDAIDASYVIDYSILCDVNSSGVVDSNDIISAYTVLEGQSYAPMAGIIKLDNNFSKTARTNDITPIISEVYMG